MSRVDKLVFTNTNTVAITVTVYYYASGDAIGNDTMLVKTKAIAAGKSWICIEAENMRLGAGDILSALSDTATSATVSCSGVEIS